MRRAKIGIVLGIAAAVGLASAAGACGGGGKGGSTLPEGDGDDDGPVAADEDSGMIPPERLDAVQRELDRKRTAATRCLTNAIDRGHAPKNARGKVTLDFVIGPDGQARQVKTVKSSVESPEVEECLEDLVRKIDFGRLPRELAWSYTYAFEAF